MKILYLIPLLLCFQPPEKEYLPSIDVTESLLDHRYFKIAYDCRHNCPVWVYYKLTKDQVLEEQAERRNNFHEDDLLNSCTPSSDNYAGTGYDRGHLCPAEDMDHSQKAMDETFVMTNISPQAPKFNRGIWKHLESFIRTTAIEEEALYIVKGTILGENNKRIPGGISIPKYFYATFINKEITKSWAYIFENKESQDPLQNNKISIDSLEKITNIDFFYSVNDKTENLLEK